MESNREDYYSTSEILNKFKASVRFVAKRWWLLALATLLGAGLGALYFSMQKPKYEATSTFILEEKQTGGGGLSSIASQFGIDIGGMGGGSFFNGDNILDILKSKKILQKVLLSPVDSNASNSPTLADLYLDFSNLKDSWKNKRELANINFIRPVSLTSTQDSVLNIVYDRMVKKHLVVDRISKRGTIIKVQVVGENSLFAKLMTERLVEEASTMYLNVKIGTAVANINRLQRRSDSLLALLNRKSFTAASVQTLDANPGIKTLAVPSEIAMRDKTVLATLYTEVTKQLETSKVLLSQQTPVIQGLDSPSLSLFDNKKPLLLLILVGGFIAFFVCLAAMVGVYLARKAMK